MRMVSALGVFCGIVLLQIPLAAVESQVYHIAMEGSAPYYTPEVIIVPAGHPIQWDNRTATAHTVTHDGCLTRESCAFDSGSVFPGNSFALPFLKPGTYPYYCRLHPIMRGVFTVIESTVKGEGASISG